VFRNSGIVHSCRKRDFSSKFDYSIGKIDETACKDQSPRKLSYDFHDLGASRIDPSDKKVWRTTCIRI
jgi:hypothetical protein